MKNKVVILVGVCLCVLLGGAYSAPAQNDAVPSGNINFVKVPVSKVLETYKALADTELIVATNVRDVRGITLRTEKPVTKDEAARMIEQALLKQAGVVITHLDTKQTSVTYNDKLELK